MKKINIELTSFAGHLDAEYGKPVTPGRENYEQGFETFKLGVMLQELRKENRIL